MQLAAVDGCLAVRYPRTHVRSCNQQHTPAVLCETHRVATASMRELQKFSHHRLFVIHRMECRVLSSFLKLKNAVRRSVRRNYAMHLLASRTDHQGGPGASRAAIRRRAGGV